MNLFLLLVLRSKIFITRSATQSSSVPSLDACRLDIVTTFFLFCYPSAKYKSIPLKAFFCRRRRKFGSPVSPETHFSPALADFGSGGSRPNPARWGETDFGANGNGPAESATRRLRRPHRLGSRRNQCQGCRAGRPFIDASRVAR